MLASRRSSFCERAAGMVVFAVALLGGCVMQPQQRPQTSPPPVAAGPADEALDPFLLAIGSERWGVLIDRARTAVFESGAGRDASDDFLLRADIAVKDGAAALLQLRNALCARGLMAEDPCRLADWPAWTSEPPSAATPPEVLRQRSDWLGERLGPFVDVGCQLGREQSGDDLFCSVE